MCLTRPSVFHKKKLFIYCIGNRCHPPYHLCFVSFASSCTSSRCARDRKCQERHMNLKLGSCKLTFSLSFCNFMKFPTVSRTTVGTRTDTLTGSIAPQGGGQLTGSRASRGPNCFKTKRALNPAVPPARLLSRRSRKIRSKIESTLNVRRGIFQLCRSKQTIHVRPPSAGATRSQFSQRPTSAIGFWSTKFRISILHCKIEPFVLDRAEPWSKTNQTSPNRESEISQYNGNTRLYSFWSTIRTWFIMVHHGS